MSYESNEKSGLTPEIEKEIELLTSKSEAIVGTIEKEENNDRLGLFKEGAPTKEQLAYIKKSLVALNRKIIQDKDFQKKIKAHTNLNHEIGNFEVYFKSFEKIRLLQDKGKNVDGLLEVFKRKIDEFYKYAVDLSRAYGLLEYEITSSDLEQKKAA